MPVEMTPQQVLDLPMQENDADAETIRGYFAALLVTLLREGEGFSGKRPFGNSGWDGDLYLPLVKADAVTGVVDEDGYLDHCDDRAADKLLLAAARSLSETPPEQPQKVPTKCGFCPAVATRRLTMADPGAALPEAAAHACSVHAPDAVLWLNETVAR